MTTRPVAQRQVSPFDLRRSTRDGRSFAAKAQACSQRDDLPRLGRATHVLSM